MLNVEFITPDIFILINIFVDGGEVTVAGGSAITCDIAVPR